MPTRAARAAAEPGSTSSASSRARIGSSATAAAAGSSITSTSCTGPLVALDNFLCQGCPHSSDYSQRDGRHDDRPGPSLQPHRHPTGRCARRPLPGPRPPARRGACPLGDRRRRLRRPASAPRLDLDSGYLSRLLRSLEAAGLVDRRRRAIADRRVRTARLTQAGRAERAVLDRRSDDAGPVAARRRSPSAAHAPRRRDGRGRAAPHRGAGRRRGRRPRPPPTPSTASHEYFAELDGGSTCGFDPA